MTRAALLLPLLLAGCISLFPDPPPPPRVFTLEAGPVARVEGERLNAVIGVAEPSGERTIMGVDLVWRTGDELAYVGGSQWSTRAAEALQAMMVETLVRQGRFNAAVAAGQGRAEFEIRWDVMDFEIDGDRMVARFTANVQIVAAPGRRVIAQEIITAEAPVASRSATEASQALTRAAREGGARIGVFAADAAAQELARAAAEDQARAASIRR